MVEPNEDVVETRSRPGGAEAASVPLGQDDGDGPPRPRSPNSNHCLRRAASVAVPCLCLVFWLAVIGLRVFVGILLVVTLYVGTGVLTGRTGWHLNIALSLLIAHSAFALIFLIVARCRRARAASGEGGREAEGEGEGEGEGEASHEGKPPATTCKKYLLTRLLPRIVIAFAIAEFWFARTAPTVSVLPLSWIGAQDALASSPAGGGLLPDGCDVAGRLKVARDLFRNSTVLAGGFDRVRVVVGGVPAHHKRQRVAAAALEDTIYLAPHACPSRRLLVHEMVHVWQFRSGWLFGRAGLRRTLDKLRDRWECDACAYDYGGFEGLEERLRRAREGDPVARDVARAFGAEQMAAIVEDYYSNIYQWDMLGLDEEHPLAASQPEHYEALSFYARQVIDK